MEYFLVWHMPPPPTQKETVIFVTIERRIKYIGSLLSGSQTQHATFLLYIVLG
jgi:hypothetical protein